MDILLVILGISGTDGKRCMILRCETTRGGALHSDDSYERDCGKIIARRVMES